ncbi:MAG TPA: tetratricopeptide repeat protein, partial [Candidatus Krumholzibacteria bacterium]|nr:tetratricopeptide repeat protein [Candidatus Krumholzibacteria bacterium]
DPPPIPEWSNETLFDATTTRAELLEMGRAAVTLEQFGLAEIYYREMLLRNPADVTAMWELAAMYRRTGRLEYARGLLTRAGALQPDRNDINEARREVERDLFAEVSAEVDRLMTAGKYESALPRIAILLSIDRENAPALAKKARCLFAIGQNDAALSNIQLAILKDPQNEFHTLRDQITRAVEQHRITELESSARRLLQSGDWVRGEASDALQALLAQDPSNQWAREQFRALSEGAAPAPLPSEPPAPRQVFDAMRDVAPGFAAALGRHLPLILGFVVAFLLLRSPLTRALASRLRRPSLFSGSLDRIDIADVLRVAHGSALSGVIVLKTPGGVARVFFENGEPVHCAAFGRSGIEALRWIVEEVHEGAFAFRSVRKMPEATIDQPLALVLADGVASPGGAPERQPRKKSRMSELLETKSE